MRALGKGKKHYFWQKQASWTEQTWTLLEMDDMKMTSSQTWLQMVTNSETILVTRCPWNEVGVLSIIQHS